MNFRKLSLSMCLVAGIGPILAQDNNGYTSVALFKVQPSATTAFVENAKKLITPVAAKLLKDGTIGGYGIDVDLFHQPGATNVALWIDVPSFAAFGKAEDAIQAALKAAPQVASAMWGATDPAAHADLMVRHMFLNMKKVPAGAMPFTNFYVVKVKPGKMEEYSQAFEKYQKPTYDRLVADGVIYGYSVDTEAIHSDAGTTVWILAVMPELGAKDKMLAATRAANQVRSAAERKAMSDAFEEVTVAGSHRDSMSQSVVFVTK